MYTEKEAPWIAYLKINDDGDVEGIRDDAPEDIKKAYNAYVEMLQEYRDNGNPIPR